MPSPIIPAFCSNLLPQEDFAELLPAVHDLASRVRQLAQLPQLGVDLRLGQLAIQQASPEDCRRWRDRLAAAQLVVSSLNIFPLPAFQAAVVKDQAYRPDWGSEERLQLSIQAIPLAEALCDPQAEYCSLSTLPGSYRPWGAGAAAEADIARQFGRWAAAAWRHRDAGGRRMVLAIEPEPCCSFGSGAELLEFWQQQRAHCVAAAAEALGALSKGEEAVVQHLATCWDCCHASVVHEEQASTIAALAAAGLPPLKVQFSAAPASRGAVSTETVQALRAMAEPRFCHQVGLRGSRGQRVLSDLEQLDPNAAGIEDPQLGPLESIRTHFHIPVDEEPESPLLQSTIAESRAGLRAALAHGARHVSVETYTWSLRSAAGDDPITGTAREVSALAKLLATPGTTTER